MTYLDKSKLKSIQEIQKDILSDFDDICLENDLDYMIYSGTLLGQVRHGGFIPWDDDIDVVMKRDDYFNLLTLQESFSENNLFLQHQSTDKNFPHHFIRIRANNTLMIQESFENIDMHQGVFIDVFPIDYLPKSKFLLRVFLFELKLNKKIRIFIGKKHKNIIKRIVKRVMLLLSRKFYFSLAERNRMKYNSSRVRSSWLADLTLDVDYKTVDKYRIHSDEYENRIRVLFEQIEVNSSSNSDVILKRAFGNYLDFPEEKDRIPHHGVNYFKDFRK